MEKLIILLLIGLGTAISNYFQNKKKREEEELEKRSPSPKKPAGGEPLIPHFPKTSADWRKELRRVMEERMNQPTNARPPVIPPAARPPPPVRTIVKTQVIKTQVLPPALPVEAVLRRSSTAHTQAAQLPGKVGGRMAEIEKQTRTARPTPISRRTGSPAANLVGRWAQSRQSLREAFVASLIFSSPVGLQSDEPYR